jgi:hypothetical protein
MVGHMGVTDSRGVAYDFAGPYAIGVDDLAFGKPVRYLQLDPERATRGRAGGKTAAEAWDAAVDAASEEYSGRMHNIVADNCHNHVAHALNALGYDGRTNWGMVSLALWVMTSGRYITTGRAIGHLAPFALVVVVVLALGLTVGRR